MTSTQPWFPSRTYGPSARLRLFCFPYAGGSASAYHKFQAALAPEVEVCAVELPGRAGRLREPAHRDFTSLLERLLSVMRGELERPYALFGYSMGSLLAFELARRASALGRPPVHLFVAARSAPRADVVTTRLSQLPDAELLAEIERRYRPIPAILQADPEMRAIVLNLMRADLALIESYRFEAARPLACPLTAFGGESDHGVPGEQLAAWGQLTTGTFRVETFPGDHFFLEPQRAPLLRALLRALRGPRAPWREPHPLETS